MASCTDFGLETADKDGALVAQCPGRSQEQVRMMEGPVKRLHHVSFTVAPGSLDEILGSLERAGTPLIEPPAGADESGAWLRDPDGTAVQLLEGEQAPARPVAEVLINAGSSRQRVGTAAWREVTADVHPATARALAAVHRPARRADRLLYRVLGLHVSDTIHHDFVTFLNAGPGDHHIFGFISSTHPGFHHASFEVPSIDAIAIGADRMRSRGRDDRLGARAPHDRLELLPLQP